MNKEAGFLAALAALVLLVGYFWYQGKSGEIAMGPVVTVDQPKPAGAAVDPNANKDIPAAGAPDPAKLPTPQAEVPEQVGARHVLIQYEGSKRSRSKRSKEEARQRAEKIRDLARAKGTDFASLAKYSDEPGAEGRGGDLGTFGRSQMVKPFADAAFALGVGQVSDVVETDFGFHVILRTK